MNTTTNRTALYEKHLELGGKIVPFAGYELPIWYKSSQEEHLAVRNHAGIFDISHMGILEFQGQDAKTYVQKLSCNSVKKSENGKMVYSMILNESGHILDDIMFTTFGSSILMVVNAANKEKIVKWIKDHLNNQDVSLKDWNQTHSFIAIQGPKAIETLDAILGTQFKTHPRFTLWEDVILDTPCIISRTGYTGEDGVEIMIPHEKAGDLWDKFLNGGITPCGLGARDSLRIESGLPLYGHELSEEISPLMTRYAWVIQWDEDFIGKEALIKEKETQSKKTIGLRFTDKCIPRQGFEIKEGGIITSGTLSYSTQSPIAMALVNSDINADSLTVMIRGKEVSAQVCPIPFI